MNRVHINVVKDPLGSFDGFETFNFVVADNYVEDIEFSMSAEPGFLGLPSHQIVARIYQENPEAADVIEAAIQNKTQVFVNEMDPMDHAAYAALKPSAPKP